MNLANSRTPAQVRGVSSAVGRQRGFSLVELLVATVIGLIGTIAMMAAFARFEGTKRTTTSGDDAQQAGVFSLYELERQVRSAGSAIVQGKSPARSIWACAISARTNAVAVLPLPAPLAAPFAGVPVTVRAIPLLVYAGGSATGNGLGSGGQAVPDVVAVISGNPAVRTVGASIDLAAAGNVRMQDSTFGFYANEYLLAGKSTGQCELGVIDAAPDHANRQFALRTAASPAAGFQTQQYLFDLGVAPVFSLFGVDVPNSRLVAFDLLRRGGSDVPAEIADGIVMLKALYGVDDGVGGTIDDGVIDEWVLPTGATWGAAALSDGSVAANRSIGRIRAVRLALVARSQLGERAADYSGATSLTLFADVPAAALQVGIEARYRYKVYDTTIPMHNSAITRIF
ncbi:PilW family protein [Tahibacter aquaticus]|nr:PilW family protein [Tahibacter aquaticus]